MHIDPPVMVTASMWPASYLGFDAALACACWGSSISPLHSFPPVLCHYVLPTAAALHNLEDASAGTLGAGRSARQSGAERSGHNKFRDKPALRYLCTLNKDTHCSEGLGAGR